MFINANTIIKNPFGEAVQRAADNLRRDMKKAFLPSEEAGEEIRLIFCEGEEESFSIIQREDYLEVRGASELGLIYGIYEVSRRFLNIEDFWFWNDQKVIPVKKREIQAGFCFKSTPFAVKYRGWFINDEVLLHTWKLWQDKDNPWEIAMETLLRCGGNLIIPGTDTNSKKYRDLAASMGLYITHHHAEPLGAEMFARRFPGLNPSYDQYPEKFRELWQDGIESQKDCKVLWNLGFRGQGDKPFWVHDPKYSTMESRGALISKIIRIQYDMLKELRPDDRCCTNLYGETMELYQRGLLDIPEDVIKIWADNGFGKMVSRRQGNHNPRVPALPGKNDKGSHGIYYHVSFYDLQAANHMTMLPNSPDFVKEELEEVLNLGIKDYWKENSSNIKPHVYYLDLLAEFWRTGRVSVKEHRERYVKRYFGKEQGELVADCISKYFKAAVSYGPNQDDYAGEQFVNHVPRMLLSQFIEDREKRAENLLWFSDAETLTGQIREYKKKCTQGKHSYKEYCRFCRQVLDRLTGRARRLFKDSFLLQAIIYRDCYKGAELVCESLENAYEKNYQKAFYLAGKAREAYIHANQAMRKREHGKWHEFYANECLTDIKQTGWVLEGFMSYLRSLGDGPHYFRWQRDFLYSPEDREVLLVMNMENHLKDLELYALMKERED